MPINDPIAFDTRGQADPLPSFNFIAYVRALPVPFSKISSIEQVVETQTLQEGGENRYVRSLRAPNTKENLLVMEHGVLSGDLLFDAVWGAATSQLFKVGNAISCIFIIVKGNDQKIRRMYAVYDLVVKKWSISELDASRSNLLIEKLELSYQRIDRTLPVGLAAQALGI